MQKSKPFIWVTHIPKCAGSTLETILIKNHSKKKVSRIDPDGVSVKGKNLTELDCAIGHLEADWINRQNIGPRPLKQFTLLRNPTQRLLSWYYYSNRNIRNLNENYPLKEWLWDCLAFTGLNNINAMTAYLASTDEVPNKYHLQEAKSLIYEDIIEVGIVEYFNLTMKLWKQEGYLTDIKCERQNVSTNPLRQQELDSKTQQLIRNLTYLDYDLYNFAKNIFFQKIINKGGKVR